MGIPTNIGWFTLYGTEFLGPLSEMKIGTFATYRYFLLALVLLSHIGKFVLPFITKKPVFGKLLIWLPLLFVVFFIAFDNFAIIYLIPFIIVWVILLGVQKGCNFRQTVKN
jgi:hypothetical protein